MSYDNTTESNDRLLQRPTTITPKSYGNTNVSNERLLPISTTFTTMLYDIILSLITD
jgi:hypothetical protein